LEIEKDRTAILPIMPEAGLRPVLEVAICTVCPCFLKQSASAAEAKATPSLFGG